MFKGAHRSAGVVERMVSAARGNGELSRGAASSNVLTGSSHGELLVVVMEKPRLRRLRWFWCGLGKGWRANGLEGGNSFSPFHNYLYWNVTLWSVVAPYGTTHASFMVDFPPPIGRWAFSSLHYSVLFLALKNISHNLLAGGNFLAYINFYVSSASCVVHEIGESFSLSLKVSKDHKLSPSWWLRSMLEITLENATNDMYCKYTNNMCHFL